MGGKIDLTCIFGDITLPPECSVTVLVAEKYAELLFGGSLVATSSEGQLDMNDQVGAAGWFEKTIGPADRIEYGFENDTQFRGIARIHQAHQTFMNCWTTGSPLALMTLEIPFAGCAKDECAEPSDDDCDNNGISDHCEISCLHIDCNKNDVTHGVRTTGEGLQSK